MTMQPGSSLETRPSLLKRLQSGDEPDSWREFYEIYGGLIRSFAGKAGLTREEAEDVVQETTIGVARRLPEFVYDPKVCRFKTWLLNQTRWQIRKQLEKRTKFRVAAEPSSPADGTGWHRPDWPHSRPIHPGIRRGVGRGLGEQFDRERHGASA